LEQQDLLGQMARLMEPVLVFLAQEHRQEFLALEQVLAQELAQVLEQELGLVRLELGLEPQKLLVLGLRQELARELEQELMVLELVQEQELVQALALVQVLALELVLLVA
jgi:hypothetical protein